MLGSGSLLKQHMGGVDEEKGMGRKDGGEG
jgi:hypothetical protein